MRWQNWKMIVMLAAALGVLIGASAWALHIGPFTSADRGAVIATVDGQPIYLKDARFRVQGLSTMHGDLQGTMGSDWHEQVLQSLIDDQIVREESERLGVGVTDQEIATEVLRLQGMFPSMTEFQSWLASQGMDLDELERRIRLQVLTVRVYQAVTTNVTVTEKELRDYYATHPEEFPGSDGGTAPFSEVRESVEQAVKKQKQDATYAEWQAARRDAAKIVILDNDWWRSVQDEQQS